ncbi:hypothetical protein TTRE_0000487501 [Trichuris trichiura]|uniref:Uncharacterized protein n=1 Tax=Trichuris trichiura TaxID=36087 RepID=A0A077ZDC8_TRITR|nr:hypothetical protein TTRE_0000487501 [Trichuris trichiura]
MDSDSLSKRQRLARYWTNSTFYFDQQQRRKESQRRFPLSSVSAVQSSQVSPVYAVPNGAEKPWLKKKTSQAAMSPSPAALLTPLHGQRTTMPPELYDDACLAPRRSSAPLPATGSYPDNMLNQDVHRLAQLIALNRQRKMLEQFYLRIKLVAYVHLLVAFLLLSSDVALIVILWPKSAPQQQLKLILRCLYAMYVLNIGIVSILAAVQRERALYVLPLLCIILIANFLLAPFQLPIVQSLVEIIDIVQYETSGRVTLAPYASVFIHSFLQDSNLNGRKVVIEHSVSYVTFICLQVVYCFVGLFHLLVTIATMVFVFRIIGSSKTLKMLE